MAELIFLEQHNWFPNLSFELSIVYKIYLFRKMLNVCFTSIPCFNALLSRDGYQLLLDFNFGGVFFAGCLFCSRLVSFPRTLLASSVMFVHKKEALSIEYCHLEKFLIPVPPKCKGKKIQYFSKRRSSKMVVIIFAAVISGRNADRAKSKVKIKWFISVLALALIRVLKMKVSNESSNQCCLESFCFCDARKIDITLTIIQL